VAATKSRFRPLECGVDGAAQFMVRVISDEHKVAFDATIKLECKYEKLSNLTEFLLPSCDIFYLCFPKRTTLRHLPHAIRAISSIHKSNINTRGFHNIRENLSKEL